MDFAIGIALALVVAGFATLVGFEGSRVLSHVLVVIASYCVLFAVISGSVYAVLVESTIMTVFAVLAVLGFRNRLWIVAAPLVGHAVFDAVHGFLVTNSGVPVWWPAFCLAFDLTAAVAMVWLLRRRLGSATKLWQTGT